VFSGVFIAEEEKGSGDTTMVDVQALLEAYLNVFLGYDSFFDEVSCKKQNFQSWDSCLEVPHFRDFRIGGH
jgi:hypothetical protein